MTDTNEAPRPNAGSRIWLLVALALVFLIRLWFVLEMRGQPFSTICEQYVDSYFYHQWALDIVRGNFWGNEVFFLRPLFPYLLAGVYALFGAHVIAVQLLQAVFATASCLLLYLVTCRFFNRRAGIFAAFGYALTGILVFYTGTFLHVEVTVLLSLLFLWLVLVSGQRILLWILAGVCFGLLVIARPEMLAVLPFILLWLWRTRAEPTLTPPLSLQGRGRNRSRTLVALTVAAAVVVLSVPVRNYLVARDPVLFTAHSGINFYIGNNPGADGTWQPPPELGRGVGFSHETLKRLSQTTDGQAVKPSAASAHWTALTFRFITREPLTYLRLLGRKLLLFLSNYEVPNAYYPETATAVSVPLKLALVNFGLVLALGMVGMLFAWPLRRQAAPAYLFVAANLLSALLFCVLSRLRAPVIPFLLMFAGYGLSEMADALKQRRTKRLLPGLLVVAVVYVGSNVIPVKRQTYSAQAWTQAGNIYLSELHNPAPAVAAFRRALAALPDYNYARYCLVLALAAQGSASEAEAEFRPIERATVDATERNTLIRLAAARLAIANSLRGSAPERERMRQLADAWLAIADGKLAKAESLYRFCLARDSSDREARFLLGRLRERLADRQPPISGR